MERNTAGAALAKSLNIPPEQMAITWEAFSLNKNTSTLDEHSFEPFRQQIIKLSDFDVDMTDAIADSAIQIKREMSPNMITPAGKRPHHSAALTTTSSSLPTRQTTLIYQPNNVVGQRHRVSLGPDPPLSQQPKTEEASAFSQRQNAGTIVATFNPNNLAPVDSASAASLHKPKCVVAYDQFDTNVSEPYRHMFTVMDDRARQLDHWLVQKGEEMQERYHFGEDSDVAALEAVNVPRQEKICCIGRICNSVRKIVCGVAAASFCGPLLTAQIARFRQRTSTIGPRGSHQ